MALRGRVRFKAEDIWDTPDDGNRYEVIDGGLYVTPPPSWAHQRGLNRLNVLIANYVFERDLGEAVTAPVGVTLDPDTAVQPDLLYISRERAEIISERGVEGAPDLVVEVLSPSKQSRDRSVKMQAYADAGVPHYWLLDPRRKSLEAFRLGEAGYERTGVYEAEDVFSPELFPGLTIPIRALWS